MPASSDDKTAAAAHHIGASACRPQEANLRPTRPGLDASQLLCDLTIGVCTVVLGGCATFDRSNGAGHSRAPRNLGSGVTASADLVNVAALYAALEAEKEAQRLSWRQLAAVLDLSPSTFTRMANGYRPDLEAFATLLKWLRQPAERFIRTNAAPTSAEPDLVASLAPLLRARKDLTEDDAKHLQVLFRAAVEEFRASRSPQ